ncbi:hypothetical protein [Leifsonia naganoensis]|uniref:DNA-binding transcriptional regulator YhcF (GntR family) n=1 Tax=Leifsonia naganoensis TaxID=150025 RepID=A0A853DTT3_9MICO|nr:hypothetical protein [Leifsonia naganoensis]NYK09065.1 DNA-binding transcriptional regulator YhcF (GntR family) [Leifsonia naganoensis]
MRTPPELITQALAALIAGGKIGGDLPSVSTLASAASASPDTIGVATSTLRARGYLRKTANQQGHEIAIPARLRSEALTDRLDDLLRVAESEGTGFDDLVSLLAGRMLIDDVPAGSHASTAVLIAKTVELLRARNPRAATRSSNRSPSKAEMAAAARSELEELHGDL